MNVAVVGAGFAGLAAAFELHTLGFAVTVLEARRRVGGRVWSKKLANGAIVELGAEWVGPGDATVFAMAKRLDLPLIEVGVDFMTRAVVNGSAVSRDDQHRAVGIAAETLAAMEEAAVARSTVGEFLENLPVSEPQRSLLCAQLQGSFGADLHQVALRMLGSGFGMGGDRRYYRAATGNQSLAKAMAALLPDVRLEHVVTAVSHHPNGATVRGQASDGAFEVQADAVISAMPVRLLAELGFDPALPPDVAEAISSVPMGVAAKLAIGTRSEPSLRALQHVEIPYWCWTGRGEHGQVRAAVTAFCGSKQAQQNLATDRGDPSTWLGKLRSVNPDLDFVNDAIMVDWSRDEWARGCYSAFDNRAMEFGPLLSRPVGRLFFAGEHTHEESATMEGALASGLRAARQVADQLGSG